MLGVCISPALWAQPVVPDWLRDAIEERRPDADEPGREHNGVRQRRDEANRPPDTATERRDRALQWRGEPAGRGLDARSAARRAQDVYGGRVLGVKRRGDSYRVRLLLDQGRVTTVTIRE